jgi:hypothetical protein
VAGREQDLEAGQPAPRFLRQLASIHVGDHDVGEQEADFRMVGEGFPVPAESTV